MSPRPQGDSSCWSCCGWAEAEAHRGAPAAAWAVLGCWGTAWWAAHGCACPRPMPAACLWPTGLRETFVLLGAQRHSTKAAHLPRSFSMGHTDNNVRASLALRAAGSRLRSLQLLDGSILSIPEAPCHFQGIC